MSLGYHREHLFFHISCRVTGRCHSDSSWCSGPSDGVHVRALRWVFEIDAAGSNAGCDLVGSWILHTPGRASLCRADNGRGGHDKGGSASDIESSCTQCVGACASWGRRLFGRRAHVWSAGHYDALVRLLPLRVRNSLPSLQAQRRNAVLPFLAPPNVVKAQ